MQQHYVQRTRLNDGSFYPELTDRGCHVMTSLMHRFTECLASGYYWSPEIPLEECFDMENDEVFVRIRPTLPLTNAGLREVLRTFAATIKKLVQVKGELPPYFIHLIYLMKSEVPPFDYLDEAFRFVLDTHICLIPSKNRENLVVQLHCWYDSLSPNGKLQFEMVVASCIIDASWPKNSFLDFVMRRIQDFKIRATGRQYERSKIGAFHLMRNHTVHAPGNCQVLFL